MLLGFVLPSSCLFCIWATSEVGPLDLPKPEIAQLEKMLHAAPFDTFRLASKAATGHTADLDAEAFAHVTSPAALIGQRNRFGGPAPAALDAVFHHYDYEFAESVELKRLRALRSEQAEHLLGVAINDLLAA
jgi:hypothetical protein